MKEIPYLFFSHLEKEENRLEKTTMLLDVSYVMSLDGVFYITLPNPWAIFTGIITGMIKMLKVPRIY